MTKEELYKIVFDTPELKEYVENKDKEIKRLNNIINELTKIIIQCKDEISITTYEDMNNCEKWETKLSGYLDILEKVKDIIGSDKE